MTLLVAQERHNICLQLFESSEIVNQKYVVKPVYYVLMEKVKSEYPIKYLKAGPELEETIQELNKSIDELKKTLD